MNLVKGSFKKHFVMGFFTCFSLTTCSIPMAICQDGQRSQVATMSCNGALYTFRSQAGRVNVEIRVDTSSIYGPMLPSQTAIYNLTEIVLSFPTGEQMMFPIKLRSQTNDINLEKLSVYFQVNYPGGIPQAFIDSNSPLTGEIVLPQFDIPPSRISIISACGTSATLDLFYSVWEYEPLWPYIYID